MDKRVILAIGLSILILVIYQEFVSRYYGAPPSAPELAQHAPDVQFQRIIHDGLVGDAFLHRFAVTYDVAGAELIFGVSLA